MSEGLRVPVHYAMPSRRLDANKSNTVDNMPMEGTQLTTIQSIQSLLARPRAQDASDCKDFNAPLAVGCAL